MGLRGLREIISTHGRGALVIGSAKVFSDGRVGGVLRFGIPSLGGAGVGAAEQDFHGTMCDGAQAVTSVSVTPEWDDDWKCDGCGLYEFK